MREAAPAGRAFMNLTVSTPALNPIPWLGAAASLALDLVFPRYCAICGAPASPEYLYLCWNCRARLPIITPPYCEICGQPVASGAGGFVCSRCRANTPWFDCARSICRYQGAMGQLVRDFKYNAALWLRHDFNLLLRAGLAAHYAAQHVDAIVFVPLHAYKERRRSFNQAQILGEGLSRQSPRLPVISALRRVRPTETQTHLTAARRIANVKGVFQVRPRVNLQGLNLLLLDDVMTTGATANECARALKAAGAARVYVLTLARG